jgi:hypothetical protein
MLKGNLLTRSFLYITVSVVESSRSIQETVVCAAVDVRGSSFVPYEHSSFISVKETPYKRKTPFHLYPIMYFDWPMS